MRRFAALLVASGCALAAQDHEVFLQLRFDQGRQGTDQYVDGSGFGSSLGLVLAERHLGGTCLQLDGRIEADRFRDDAFHIELNGIGIGLGARLYTQGKPQGFYVIGALTAQHWGYTSRSSAGLQTFGTTRPGQKLGVGWRESYFYLEGGIHETVVDADLRWSHTYFGVGLQF
jgi:hypothetical protein